MLARELGVAKRLPLPFSAVERTYRPGQENDRDVSRDYLAAAREVQEWIRANYAPMQGRLI
jgi:hypothetical protein